MHKQQIVVAELEAAFRRVEPPPSIEPNGRSYEAVRAANFFSGRHWQDVTLDLLQSDYPGDVSACLEFLAPEAGLYFLPAYLRICVVAYRASDMLPYTLERQLSEKASTATHFGRLTNFLAIDQRRAVANVLAFVHGQYEQDFEESGAAIALQNGWGRFLDQAA